MYIKINFFIVYKKYKLIFNSMGRKKNIIAFGSDGPFKFKFIFQYTEPNFL